MTIGNTEAAVRRYFSRKLFLRMLQYSQWNTLKSLFCFLENTLQEENKSPCDIWVWPNKNWGRFYWLVRKNQKKFLKDVKLLPSEEYITQHKPLVCKTEIRKVKETRRKFTPRKKIWELHEDSGKSHFRSCINKYRANNQKRCFCWRLLERSERSFARGYRQEL